MENTYSDVRVSGVKVKGDTLSTTCGQLDKEQFIEGGRGGGGRNLPSSVFHSRSQKQKRIKEQFEIRMF